MSSASIIADFWDDQIVAEGKQALFMVLAGFVLSFAFIRMSTRLMRSPKVTWWPGSVVSESGVHLHRRTERFKEAFRDIVGGKPSEGVAAASHEALAATREAAAEVRQRAERITHPGDRQDR